MTYKDPTHIRDLVVKVRLSEEELAVVDALAKYNRRQRAAFIRELLLANAQRFEAKRSAGAHTA